MKKIALDLNTLEVESFNAGGSDDPQGTIRAASLEDPDAPLSNGRTACCDTIGGCTQPATNYQCTGAPTCAQSCYYCSQPWQFCN